MLYDVVHLMAEPEIERALTAVADRIRMELEFAVVVIVFGNESPIRVQADTGDSEAIALAREALGPAEMVLGGGQAPTASERGQPGRWIRIVPPTARTTTRTRLDRVRSVPVSMRGQPVGSIILVPAPGARRFGLADDRLLSAVAHQLGLALERLSLQRQATEAEVLRRTDELRKALLDAVSHDLRTPLSSIMASASTTSRGQKNSAASSPRPSRTKRSASTGSSATSSTSRASKQVASAQRSPGTTSAR